MSGVAYVYLYIKHPLFESLKRYLMLQDLLIDQALFNVQGTTLQLGQVEGATEIPTRCWSRNLQFGLLKQIKMCVQVSLESLQNL